ncbi:TPA: hypothetical protein H1012_03585 [archaeon]|nr:hypothetical protein [Candidatus Naiadarchaeales archaeon SRR2090153.bin461]HIK02898.1 hypothetical protein [Candidatus Naiadarchaeales archaeon SRR2090159.bin1288]
MDFMLNRKGITPIIAVILLLMMTIAIAGLAYTWLQRTQATIQTSTENTTITLLAGLKVNLKVEGYNSTCVMGGVAGVPNAADRANPNISVRIYGRNAGTEPAHNVLLYIDDALSNTTVNSSLNPGVTTSWGTGTGNLVFSSNDNCSKWVNKTIVIKMASDEASAEKSFTFTCTQYFVGGTSTSAVC